MYLWDVLCTDILCTYRMFCVPLGCSMKAVVPSASVTAWTVCVSICWGKLLAGDSKDKLPPCNKQYEAIVKFFGKEKLSPCN